MTVPLRPVPKWILIVSAIFALMEIGVSFAICFAPEAVAGHVDLSTKGVEYLMQMWSARQFALGFIFAFAALKRSIPMLTIAYVFFFVMFAGDLCVGILQKENGLIISAIVMCAISALMLMALNKQKKASLG